MTKEKMLSTLCSAAGGIYITEFFRAEKEERQLSDLIFGIIYIALSVAWIAVNAKADKKGDS